jgi:hypothetical protein
VTKPKPGQDLIAVFAPSENWEDMQLYLRMKEVERLEVLRKKFKEKYPNR